MAHFSIQRYLVPNGTFSKNFRDTTLEPISKSLWTRREFHAPPVQNVLPPAHYVLRRTGKPQRRDFSTKTILLCCLACPDFVPTYFVGMFLVGGDFA
jgi:hypothetical protein